MPLCWLKGFKNIYSIPIFLPFTVPKSHFPLATERPIPAPILPLQDPLITHNNLLVHTVGSVCLLSYRCTREVAKHGRSVRVERGELAECDPNFYFFYCFITLILFYQLLVLLVKNYSQVFEIANHLLTRHLLYLA